MPAFPDTLRASSQSHSNQAPWEAPTGLTKREYFAAVALQGYASAGSTGMPEPDQLAALAVVTADALLTELSKPQP